MQTTDYIGQLPLLGPDLTPIVPIKAAKLSIDERFRLFHAANPQVYAALRDMALAQVAAGHGRLSIKMLWEVLRYRAMLTTGDEWRMLNNDFTRCYSWLLMDSEPDLAGVFEKRERR